MEASNLRWCVIPAQGKRVPEWARSAALADDGTVFAPAVVSGSEMNAILCAAHDGIVMVQSDGHTYLPVDWIKTEYPQATELATKIERGVREFFA